MALAKAKKTHINCPGPTGWIRRRVENISEYRTAAGWQWSPARAAIRRRIGKTEGLQTGGLVGRGAGGVVRNSDDKSDIDEVLRQAGKYPNVTGAVLDDFFSSWKDSRTTAKIARHSVGSIAAMRDRLHNFPKRKLDLWIGVVQLSARF